MICAAVLLIDISPLLTAISHHLLTCVVKAENTDFWRFLYYVAT